MKKILVVLLIAMTIVALCACASENNSAIIGVWKSPGTPDFVYQYTFRENGTGEWCHLLWERTNSGTFTYEYDQDTGRLTMTRDNGTLYYDIAVTPKAMILSSVVGNDVATSVALVKISP